MANTLIQIKRSTANAAPNTLQAGELAYSYNSNVLFIGTSANTVINAGGRLYTNLLDQADSSNGSSTLVRRDPNGVVQFSQLDILLTPSSNSHVATKIYVDSFKANSAYDAANAAYAQANAANDNANTRVLKAGDIMTGQLNISSGGLVVTGNVGIGINNPTANLHVIGNTIITKDLVVSGNLFVEGNTTTLNVHTLEIEDNDIVLNANTTGAPVLNATITIDRGTSPNTFLRWNEQVDRWGWSDDGNTFYTFITAVDALNLAQNAYIEANAAYGQADFAAGIAQGAYNQANAAYIQANSAYAKANAPITVKEIYAGNSGVVNTFTNINTLQFDADSGMAVVDEGANAVTIKLNSTFKTWNVNGGPGLVAFGLDTVNFVSANGISLSANNLSSPKTFTIDAIQLPNAYNQANNAYNQANAAYNAANSAKVTVFANSGAANATTQVVNFVNTQAVLVTVANTNGNANISFVTTDIQANNAYAQANLAYTQANNAYGQANNAYGQANNAYTTANNAANTVRVSGNSNSTLHAVSLNFTNTASINVTVTSGASGNANISFSANNSNPAALGPQGYQGVQGNQGFQGVQGNQGFQGVVGAQGPQGVQGAQGAQGFQGVVGAQGAQGFQGVQGAIGAQGAQGVQGAVGAQGVQGNQGFQGVVGAQGPQGAQGFQGVQGSVGAQGAQGVQGAVGAQGAQGIQGSTGPQGFQGVVGAQGAVGAQGVQGSVGAQGAQGVQGAVGAQGAQGFQGVVGAQGVQGAVGAQGSVGAQGVQGAIGAQGAQGFQGVAGAQGVQGSQGRQGVAGTFGGASFDYEFRTQTTDPINLGSGLLQFNASPFTTATTMYISFVDKNAANVFNFLNSIDDSTSAIKGNFKVANTANVNEYAFFDINGTHIHDEDHFNVPVAYTSGTATTFANTANITISLTRTGDKGDTGAQGAQGVQGAVGAQGAQGVIGAQGTAGAQGPQGVQGAAGAQGTAGAQGAVGAQGVQGSVGAQGAQGVQGAVGAQGAQGFQGVVGAQGVQGAVGAQGAQGVQGTIGAQGAQGVQGATGPQGVQGAQGAAGAQGTAGAQGAVGAQGVQGAVGAQGAQGVQGTVGAQGAQGVQGAVGAQGVQGATGPIGGSNTQILFNNNGTTGGSANLTFNLNQNLFTFGTTTLFANATSGQVGLGTTSPQGKLDIASGNTVFSGTKQFIIADFSSSGTGSNARLHFQTSNVNSTTIVGALPSGTGTNSGFRAHNSSDPDNTSWFQFSATSTDHRINSNFNGTGSALPITIYTNGLERARFDTTGNVGIATTSPTSNLHVVGNVNATLGINTATINVTTVNTSTITSGGSLTINPFGSTVVSGASQRFDFYVNGTYQGPSIQAAAANNLFINPNGAANVYIGGNGVGFPATLTVRQAGAANAAFSVENSGASASWLYVASTGRVGIGTTSPTGNLVVSDAGASGVEFFHSGGVGSGPYFNAFNRTTGLYVPFTYYANTHTFYTNAGSTRAVDIDAQGDVGLGVASPTYKLEVNGSIGVTNTTGTVIFTQYGNIFTTSAATLYTVDTFASATFRSAKYFAQMEATVGPTYGVMELNLIHDGTTVWLTQYGENKSNASANLGIFDATITAGALNLTYTPGSVYPAQTVKVVRLAVTD